MRPLELLLRFPDGVAQFLDPRNLVAHGELRAIARDDARSAQDQRRLLSRLRMDLLNILIFPAALQIAGKDLAAPTPLRLLERWPAHGALATASPEDLVAFARTDHHGWPERFAERVSRALGASHFGARPGLVRAKAGSIRLAAQQLLLIGQQRKAWERRIGELLLLVGRYGRERQPKADEVGGKFPNGEICPSCPGPGDRLAAKVAAEIGDHIE